LATEKIAAHLGDLKLCVIDVDEGLAGAQRRLDRLEARVDRIERRLEPADAEA
jgi:archaellum component FlaC